MHRTRLSLLLSAILISALSPARGEDYAEARREVAVAVSSHQNAEALQLLEPLLKTHPQDPSLWTLRGMALDAPKHTGESIDSFDKALKLDKDYLPALKGASQVAYLHGDPRAGGYVERLLAVSPTNEVAHAMAAALAYDQKDCKGSIDHFEHSGEQALRNVHALAEFSDCLVKQGQWTQAGKVLTQGAELNPESAETKYNLALVEVHEHHPEQVIAALEPMTDAKDSQLLNLLATAYVQANKPDDAFRVYEDAILADPTDQSNYLDLATLCLEHHEENRAVVAATAGIAKIPKAASLYLIRGVGYAQLADYEKAEKDFSYAAEIDPDKSHSTIAMSLLYSDRNQVDKEKSLLVEQLKATPNDAVANYLLADIMLREGAEPGQPKFEEAKADLTRSLTAKSDSVEAQVLMGTLCQQEEKLPEALEHFDQALKIEPDNRSALDHELMVLRKLHRNSEAMAVADRLKRLLSDQVRREREATTLRVSP